MILNSHESLMNYYLTNFNLMFYLGDKKFDPLTWDSTLIPFERQLYLDLLNDKLEKQQKEKDQKLPPEFAREPTQEEFG